MKVAINLRKGAVNFWSLYFDAFPLKSRVDVSPIRKNGGKYFDFREKKSRDVREVKISEVVISFADGSWYYADDHRVDGSERQIRERPRAQSASPVSRQGPAALAVIISVRTKEMNL